MNDKRTMQEVIDSVPCWEVWDVVKEILESRDGRTSHDS